MARKSVDLPQPLGPTSERNWPRRSLRLTSASTRLGPNQWWTPRDSSASGCVAGSASGAFIPGTALSLEQRKRVVHREAERRQQRQVGIDHAHVEQFRLEPDAIAKAHIADEHFCGDQEEH